jgi:hypothetical protein
MGFIRACLVLTLVGCWSNTDFWYRDGLAGLSGGGARVLLTANHGIDSSPETLYKEIDIDGTGTQIANMAVSSPSTFDKGAGTDVTQLSALGITITADCPSMVLGVTPTITSTGAVAWTVTPDDLQICTPLTGGEDVRALSNSLLLAGYDKGADHIAVLELGFDGTVRWRASIPVSM